MRVFFFWHKDSKLFKLCVNPLVPLKYRDRICGGRFHFNLIGCFWVCPNCEWVLEHIRYLLVCVFQTVICRLLPHPPLEQFCTCCSAVFSVIHGELVFAQMWWWGGAGWRPWVRERVMHMCALTTMGVKQHVAKGLCSSLPSRCCWSSAVGCWCLNVLWPGFPRR